MLTCLDFEEVGFLLSILALSRDAGQMRIVVLYV